MGSLASPMNESKLIYPLPVKDIFIAYQVLGRCLLLFLFCS